jgi:hypothetical protein
MFNNIFGQRRTPQELTPLPQCPGCGSQHLVEVVDVASSSAQLVPQVPNLKWLRSPAGIELTSNRFQMCRDCGLLFRRESAEQLNAYIARHAKDGETN